MLLGSSPDFLPTAGLAFKLVNQDHGGSAPDRNSCPGARWRRSSHVYKRVPLCIYPKEMNCCLQLEVMAKLRSAEDSVLSHFLDCTTQQNLAEVLQEITFLSTL